MAVNVLSYLKSLQLRITS